MSNRGKNLLRHGLSGTPEYFAWKNAKSRCINVNDADFADYGGRGIQMHPEWTVDPRPFLEYIGPKPTPKHTLERIRNSEGYVPGNVKWSTRRENLLNRRPHKAIQNFTDTELLNECKRRGINARR